MGHVILRTIVLAISLSFFFAGCGGNEAKVSPSRQAPDGTATDPATGFNPSGGKTRKVARLPEKPPLLEGRVGVRISPSFPSRMDPPILVVDGAPQGKDREFRGVVWVVNGRAIPGMERMDPGWFGKGDRIRARGTVRFGGEEVPFETQETVALNSPPEIESVQLEPKAPTTGSKVRVIARGKDPDGDPVVWKYRWFVDDEEVPGDGDALSLAGVKRDSWVHAKVSTSDGIEEGPWKFTPKYRLVNSLPVVKSHPPSEVPPDRKFSYRILAEDPDGDDLRYALVKAPPGMVLTGSTLEWEVPDDMLAKPVEVVVDISDGNGGRTICTLSMKFQNSTVSGTPISPSRAGS
ncbi:MAG: hypothetical protein A2Z40_04895 [Deltaproteobacteria bacterium RBG_19FT_COMBO_60_16]|nr:MAG: hypothetical protein A2Z40_04895 [Deltaproteobacteria bacterium RBG_19FT_COMBO_60_16]